MEMDHISNGADGISYRRVESGQGNGTKAEQSAGGVSGDGTERPQ